MATYTVTIPSNILTRVIDGIAYQHKYHDNIPDPNDPSNTIPNPESKIDFAKRMNRDWIRTNVRAWEANEAADDARETAISDADVATDPLTVI